MLVLEMTPLNEFHLAKVMADGPRDTEAADPISLTSHFQISQDLVEEWIACESPPLSTETRFFEFER